MRRHAGDMHARSSTEIVHRRLRLPIGLELCCAIIPAKIALQLVVGDERAVGLVENRKGFVPGDLQQVIQVLVDMVRSDPMWRSN